MMGDNGRLRITKNLVTLERGAEELLLANSFYLQPLYFRKGRDYVRRFLDALAGLNTREEMLAALSGGSGLLDLLITHRILVPEADKDGHDGSELASFKGPRTNQSGMSIYLLLSQSCNFGCIYCLNGTKTYKTGENLKMSEEVAFRGVEKSLASLAAGGRLEVAFFGGEPLLNWDLAKRVIEHCESELKPRYSDKEVTYHITSNLSFLPKDLIEWAKKYNISFLCDIDGPEDIHNRCRPYKGGAGSYSDVSGNVRKLIDAGLDVSLRATVTSINQHRMTEVAAHHRSIGGRGSAFVPVNPVNSDEDILNDNLLPDPRVLIDGLVEVYRSKIYSSENLFPFSIYSTKIVPGAKTVMGCGAPYGNTPVVDVNGDAYPCIYLVGIKKFFMGNVLRDDYPDTGLLDRMMDLLHVDNIEECKSCSWRYICGGGCPVGRLTVLDNPTVTPGVKDYCTRISCDYTRKILELLFWELAEEASQSAGEAASRESSVAKDAVRMIRC